MSGSHGLAEIPLPEELLSSFCRRGRRKLREIQAACGVELRLDRARGALLATGPASGVEALRRHLAGLVGHRRDVSLAAWAELMRTRTFEEGEDATMLRMQEECGCRIHIERSAPEVVIFGEGHGVLVAEGLLADFERRVAETSVPAADVGRLSPALLQRLAHRRRVTLRAEPSRLLVLGFVERLGEAVADVSRYVEDPQGFEAGELASHSDDDSAPDDESGLVDVGAGPPSTPLKPRRRDRQAREQTASPPTGEQGDAKRGDAFCAAACPTCGCGRFCAHCGTPVWRFVPVDMGAFSSQVRMMMPPQSWASSAGSTGTPPTPDEKAWVPGCSADGGQDVMMMPTMMPVCLVPAMGGNGHMVPMLDGGVQLQQVLNYLTPMPREHKF